MMKLLLLLFMIINNKALGSSVSLLVFYLLQHTCLPTKSRNKEEKEEGRERESKIGRTDYVDYGQPTQVTLTSENARGRNRSSNQVRVFLYYDPWSVCCVRYRGVPSISNLKSNPSSPFFLCCCVVLLPSHEIIMLLFCNTRPNQN